MIDDAKKMLATLFAVLANGFIELRPIRLDGRAMKPEFFDVAATEQVAQRAIQLRDTANVYVGVAARVTEASTKAAVQSVQALWIDLDPDSPGGLTDLLSFPLGPSLVVSSGRGHHAYWSLAGAIDPAQAEALNRQLAAHVGSDPAVVDAGRIMRVPGTLNHKTDPPSETEVLEATERRYTVADIKAALTEPLAAPPTAPPATVPTKRASRTVVADPSPTDRVLDLLEQVHPSGDGWKARCPAHDDTNPSLAVSEGDDGRCLLHCFAGCSVDAVVDALGLTMPDLFPDDGDDHHNESLASMLVGIAESADVVLFHDSADVAYARVPVADHHEVWTVGSRHLKRWLRFELHRQFDRLAKAEAVNEAVEYLSAEADFDGPELEVHLRSAWIADGFAYNLADENGGAGLVTPTGWSVGVTPEAAFLRRESVQAIPAPVHGGSIDPLRRYVNVETEEDFMLIVAWLLMSLRPAGPYPVLVIQGPQGSAKSTLTRVLKALVDPVKAPVRSLPGGLRDLAITMDSNWVLAIDNLSLLKDHMSDAFCRLATGGGYATRALWTDDEERIFEQMRPVILNGLDAVVTRQDLLGRSIVMRLPKISEAARMDEETFWTAFAADREAILGALLDAASCALANWSEAKVEGLRMADFVRWASAGIPAFGWSTEAFVAAYDENLSGALKASLEGSLLATVVMRLASYGPVEGKPTDVRKKLVGALNDDEKATREFPRTAQAMSRQLTLLTTALAEAGIEVVMTTQGSGRGKTRWIEIRSTSPEDATQGTQSEERPPDDGGESN